MATKEDRGMSLAAVEFHSQQEYARGVHDLFEPLLEAYPPAKDWFCLDVGSGPNLNASLILAKRVREVVAIDFDDVSLARARALVSSMSQSLNVEEKTLAAKIRLEKVNAENMEGIADNEFSCVATIGGLRHCLHWGKAYSESMRVLESGGIFYLCGEVIMPQDMIDIWKLIDAAQGRNEYYWESRSVLEERISREPVQIVRAIWDQRFRRSLGAFLDPVQDKQSADRLREGAESLLRKYQAETQTTYDDGTGDLTFSYRVASFVLRKKA